MALLVVAFVLGEAAGLTGGLSPIVAAVVGASASTAMALGLIVAAGVGSGRQQRSQPGPITTRRAVIFGAGEGGRQTIRALRSHANRPFEPVALIDDDPAKANDRIHDVAVRGTRHQLDDVITKARADVLIVAVPSASSTLLRSLGTRAADLGVELKVLPPARELAGRDVVVADIRDLNESDLLNRRAMGIDHHAIAGYLTGKRVLVTGAGGPIGVELARQITTFDPAAVILLDRDDSALHLAHLAMGATDRLDDRNLVIADVRDGTRIDEVFTEHTPDVVFHAAALTHLQLLERFPEEAWKTNVEGTYNVLRAAAKVGVAHFVNLSTDKASDPTSALGSTKRVAERLTAWYANRIRGDWVSVRFGDVHGSRASALGTFEAQIDAGGPITLAHPDLTRFFTTPVEVCQLVLQAGAVGVRGEAIVLDMGEPVRLAGLAERLIEASGRDIQIVFTGLEPGDKLHETPISVDELDIRRSHELLSHVLVPALNPASLERFDRASDDAAMRSLAELCDLDVQSALTF